MQQRRHRYEWSVAEKRQIVEEASQPGAVVAYVGRRHGVSSAELYQWIAAAREGRLREDAENTPTFIPVVIEDNPVPAAASPAIARDALAMTVSLPAGEALKFDARVDPELLGRVLQVLRR